MALSACPKCAKHLFELKIIEPSGSKYKQGCIQCSSCGCVVGVTDFYNTGALIKDQEKEIEKLMRRVATVERGLSTINGNLDVILRAIKRL